MKPRPASKFTNLKNMNERNLDNQTSNVLNQQPSYVHQPSFCINHTKNYSSLQDGGWIKNEYRHLQG